MTLCHPANTDMVQLLWWVWPLAVGVVISSGCGHRPYQY